MARLGFPCRCRALGGLGALEQRGDCMQHGGINALAIFTMQRAQVSQHVLDLRSIANYG
jgi:hypothetical protein